MKDLASSSKAELAGSALAPRALVRKAALTSMALDSLVMIVNPSSLHGWSRTPRSCSDAHPRHEVRGLRPSPRVVSTSVYPTPGMTAKWQSIQAIHRRFMAEANGMDPSPL